MAAVMDLDLNRAPPEPEPATQDHRLGHAMLRQEHAYRHQVPSPAYLLAPRKNLFFPFLSSLARVNHD